MPTKPKIVFTGYHHTINRGVNCCNIFNKKYKRSGYLWQDRYKFKYITSENYLYTLLRYIEYNHLEAGISLHVSEYPYTFWFSNI
ncbi:hypothetical protein HUE87_06835 [Candidatus Sulfurimonas marisnigri]|uniref:Transposase n=1 Tax=Candidatus Sulfurimonas marisnigri TaxID=2740405 RepID=A0A7S7LY58_9BACT|nr:hypothetical protein [Candidatus Sulfurimonas marisnigri]QOY53634.1 hypothetical protein HUE87_06835 [Candidatus Sulfurimonas marisnigri]